MLCMDGQPSAFTTGAVNESEQKSKEEENTLCLETRNHHVRQCQLSEDSTSLQWYTYNTAIQSILQGYKKPLCGLVALGMAGNMLRKLKPSVEVYSPHQLLDAAIQLGISKTGEMFSVYEMENLAIHLYDCKTTVVEKTLNESYMFVLKELLLGNPVLVPYDNDRNFEPCTKKGHKAHWAILTGAMVGCSNRCLMEDDAENINKTDVWRVKNRDCFLQRLCGEAVSDLCGHFHPSAVYVYAKQGKSAKNRLWSLNSLSISNSNLTERDPTKDWSKLHCPYDITDTLRSKYLVLHV